MSSDILKALAALRQQRGLSLQELADKMGTTKSQVDKLEKGERRLTVEWLLKMADALEVAPATLLPPTFGVAPVLETGQALEEATIGGSYQSYPFSVSAPLSSPPWIQPWTELARSTPALLPVLVKADHENGTLRLQETPSSFVPRPPSLFGIPAAFALYVPDNRHQPRFEAGDLLYINPERPMTEGKWSVVASANKEVILMPYAAAVVKAERKYGVGVVVGLENA